MVPPYSPLLQGSLAVCDDSTKTIYVSNKISGPLLRKVLRHEITHAVLFSYNEELDIEQEELIAGLIATYGVEILGLADSEAKKIKGAY